MVLFLARVGVLAAMVLAFLAPVPSSAAPVVAARATLPSDRLHFGLANGPGAGLNWIVASGIPWRYRYQYLAGGINTGTTVVLTGSAGCAGSPEYRFWVRDPSGRWSVVRDYSSVNTYSWNTTGLAPGSYGLEVDVRNQSSTAAYETVSNLSYTLS